MNRLHSNARSSDAFAHEQTNGLPNQTRNRELTEFLSSSFHTQVVGPKLMENRKPFQLKNTLIVYNLFQVLFSTWLFYEVRFFGFGLTTLTC